MAELHEPMRHLVLIETTEERLRAPVDGNARLTRLGRGGWMRLGRVDPDSREITLLRHDQFVPRLKALGWEGAAASELPAVLDWRRDRPMESAAC